MPKNSPALDGEGDVAQRAQRVAAGPAERVQRPLLERVDALVGQPERLRDAVDDDGGEHLGHNR